MTDLESSGVHMHRVPLTAHRAFIPGEDPLDTWVLQFRSHLEMNFVVEDNLRRSCLIASLAPKAFEELRRSCLPNTPYDLKYEECVRKLHELYGSRIILTHERAKFFQIKQLEGQSPKEFANVLRNAAAQCSFDSFDTNAALSVQFINGMRNEHMKKRLLAARDVKFEEAVEGLELEEDIHRSMDKETVQPEVCKVHPQRRTVNEPKCHCCGKCGHFAKNCKFSEAKCFKCGKKGHIANACNAHTHKAVGINRKQFRERVNCMRADGVYAVRQTSPTFDVDVKVNGRTVMFLGLWVNQENVDVKCYIFLIA